MPKPTSFRAAFERAVGPLVPSLILSEETGSTNDDARRLARDGAPHLTTVVANEQRAGRGRQGRMWVADPGEALLCSWVVRPSLAVDRWGVLPLAAGVAVVEAVAARARVEASLKWPNDVVIDGAKLAGILVEAEPPGFAVVGVGVNVSQLVFPDGLAATSLAMQEAVRLDRADLLAAILSAFEEQLADADGVVERYRARCSTIGREVRVIRPGVDDVIGQAESIADDGSLVVGGEAFAAGEVLHLR